MEFYDPLESCPYNIMHRILRSRMQFHVAICAQNHKHLDMLQCPFDARHVIKRVEFEHHKNTCPARESVLNYADHDPKAHAELKILPIDVKPVGKWREKWDKDPDVKTYNPIENIKNKPIVYPLIGVSKTKRKKHRLAERDRYNRVKEYSGNSFSRNSSYSESMNTSSKLSYLDVVYEIGESTNEQGYNKPLRPPTKYIAVNPVDKSVDEVTKEITESPRCIARDSEKSASMSDIDETSNDSFSSASLSSSNKNCTSSKVPSEDFEIFKKLPRDFYVTTASTKNTEQYVIPDEISIVSNMEKYEFDAHQNKGQQKCSVPDLFNMGSSIDDYQFKAHQYNDQEKYSIADAVSTVSSKDLHQFESLQPKDQNISSIPDLIVSSEDKHHFVSYQDRDEEESVISDHNTYSIVSSKDKYGFESCQYNEPKRFLHSVAKGINSSKNNYQFMQCQYEDYEKSSIVDKVSVISSRDDYGFEPYQYNQQEECSIPDITFRRDHHKFVPHQYEDYEKSSFADTVSVTSSKVDNYQFGPHKYRNYEKSPTPDTFSVISNKDDCQLYQYNDREKFSILDKVNTTFSQDKYLHRSPKKSLSLTVDEISENNSEYSFIEDDTAVLSETIKKVEDDTAVLSETNEKLAEKNGDKDNYLMTDTVYDASSDDESQCNVTKISKNSNVTSPSSDNYYETASESFSYKTAESSFSSDSPKTMIKPLEDVGIFGKIFQIFKDVTTIDKGRKKKNESLNCVDPSKGKLFPRCGANFLNLK